MKTETLVKSNKKETDPLILEVKGNSLDDGPGIRSVVFFKGCPLDCVWCHNPESKRGGSELSHDRGLCIGCGACADACPEKTISLKTKTFINRSKCTLCFACIDACPSGALSRVGSSQPLSRLITRLEKDKPFYDTSGGGVTLSGGEPTLNIDYCGQLAQSLKEKGIHVLLETCGLFDMDNFLQKIYPYIDEIYFDIKIIDEGLHKKYCGTSNSKILKNFSLLQEKFLSGGVSILPRTPLIPGITATAVNLQAIAAFLKNEKVDHTALLAYNPLWHEKNKKIGINNKYSKIKSMKKFMSQDEVNQCRNIFEKEGIEVV